MLMSVIWQEGLFSLFQVGDFHVYCNESRLLYSYGSGSYSYMYSSSFLSSGYLDGDVEYSLPESQW